LAIVENKKHLKKHQIVAIIGGIILALVSFAPVDFALSEIGVVIFWHHETHFLILYPKIGIFFASLMIIFSLMRE
jgi:hypothetical protein